MHSFRTMFLIVLCVGAFAFAADKDGEKPVAKPDSDPKKLPEGSVWVGTIKHLKNDKLISSTDLVIRITERKGPEFKGVWSANKGESQLVIEGRIADNNRLHFEPVKRIKGEGPKIVVGNAKSVAYFKNNNTELEGANIIPETKIHSQWSVTLKKADDDAKK